MQVPTPNLVPKITIPKPGTQPQPIQVSYPSINIPQLNLQPQVARPPLPGQTQVARPPLPGQPQVARPPLPGQPQVARPPLPGQPQVVRPPLPGQSQVGTLPLPDQVQSPFPGQTQGTRPPLPGQTPVPLPQPPQIMQLNINQGVNSNVVNVPKQTAIPMVNLVQETNYTLLANTRNNWNGSDDHISQLAQLRYKRDNKPIIDPLRKDILLEIIGMLVKSDFNTVYDFLSEASDPEYILWEQESMDEGRDKLLREKELDEMQEAGVKGVTKCRYCPSTELVFSTRQTRSGDEGATIYVRCVLCSKQWRE